MYGGCGEGAQEEAEDRRAAAEDDSWVQVWIPSLQVLPSGSLEECELGPFCACPDSELGGRSPVHTGPGQHLWDVCRWWLDPGMWSPASSTPPASSLCSLLQVDTSLATACPLPWSLCCLQVGM